MDVILHVGAQRTATTTLQSYLRAHVPALGAQGIAVWGPLRTRQGGLLSGIASDAPVQPEPGHTAQIRKRIHKRLDEAAQRGVKQLLVTDENMLGTVRRNLRGGELYPDAAERLALFGQAFDGAVTRVVLSIRAQDSYWPSAWAYAVARGYRLPSPSVLTRTAQNDRSWRHVVEDAAQVFGGCELLVMGHDGFAGRPDIRLRHILDNAIDAPEPNVAFWRNRAPELPQLRECLTARGEDPNLLPEGEGRWMPFNNEQAAQLRETYQDDLFWLHAGAGGLARYIEEDQPDQAGSNLPGGATTRGSRHDRQDGRLARAG